MRRKEKEQQPWPQGQSPRVARYGWALAISALVGLSLAMEDGSKWAPLVNTAIDLLQQQISPTGNK